MAGRTVKRRRKSTGIFNATRMTRKVRWSFLRFGHSPVYDIFEIQDSRWKSFNSCTTSKLFAELRDPIGFEKKNNFLEEYYAWKEGGRKCLERRLNKANIYANFFITRPLLIRLETQTSSRKLRYRRCLVLFLLYPVSKRCLIQFTPGLYATPKNHWSSLRKTACAPD